MYVFNSTVSTTFKCHLELEQQSRISGNQSILISLFLYLFISWSLDLLVFSFIWSRDLLISWSLGIFIHFFSWSLGIFILLIFWSLDLLISWALDLLSSWWSLDILFFESLDLDWVLISWFLCVYTVYGLYTRWGVFQRLCSVRKVRIFLESLKMHFFFN